MLKPLTHPTCFVVDHHGMHVSTSFSVVGNELKLNIVLGSEVNLYTAIKVHGPTFVYMYNLPRADIRPVTPSTSFMGLLSAKEPDNEVYMRYILCFAMP